MIEKEAKEKTCPFIQHAALVALALDSNGVSKQDIDDKHVPANINCITTGCMAWCEGSWLNDQDDGYCTLIQKG